MSTIKLTLGQVALVDENDFVWLSQYKWHANIRPNYSATAYHAMRRIYRPGGNSRNIAMHREIMSKALGRELEHSEYVDHINGNPLDNRRSNLRLATANENQHNQRVRRNNKSGYKGVIWDEARRKWRASICANRKHSHLGRFDTPEDAARAYDEAARELHGEFAYQNFPKQVK